MKFRFVFEDDWSFPDLNFEKKCTFIHRDIGYRILEADVNKLSDIVIKDKSGQCFHAEDTDEIKIDGIWIQYVSRWCPKTIRYWKNNVKLG